jgi:hypothetical protein
MPIGTRARFAALAVALVVTALIGAPVVASGDGAPVSADAVANAAANAKPSQKPKPPHPHATATPAPTSRATPKPTPNPAATAAPDATPRRTDRPRKGDATPRPSKAPADSASGSGDATATPRDPADGMSAPGGGSASSAGPSPELLGFAGFLAAVVGLGTLWVFTRRRRKPGPALTPVAARVQAAPPPRETWTNVRLDDNEALPSWLRLDAAPERAQLAHMPPVTPMRPFEPPPLPDAPLAGVADAAPDAREPRRFVEPMSDGALRLVVETPASALLDQPNEQVGVVLATLIAGDDVEVQDLEESWVRVTTPLGSSGWIRAESLGFAGEPTAGAEPAAASRSDQQPIAGRRRGLRLPRRSRSAEQPS